MSNLKLMAAYQTSHVITAQSFESSVRETNHHYKETRYIWIIRETNLRTIVSSLLAYQLWIWMHPHQNKPAVKPKHVLNITIMEQEK